MKRILYIFFTCIGLLCVIFPRQITVGLPYILGGTMAVAGITYIAAYFRSHAAADRSTELASGFVLLVIGILCVSWRRVDWSPWNHLGHYRHPKSLKVSVRFDTGS